MTFMHHFILIWSHTYDVIYISSESEGTFEYGNYWKEVEDLHSVLLYFSEKDYETSAIVGHSKGRCSLHVTIKSFSVFYLLSSFNICLSC